ncbi:MAG: hypothetical protein K0S63_628 [Gammaproteobacteria bacterium]|nr:hypothetical protein [Gammaproteobacteria bacterium]
MFKRIDHLLRLKVGNCSALDLCACIESKTFFAFSAACAFLAAIF